MSSSPLLSAGGKVKTCVLRLPALPWDVTSPYCPAQLYAHRPPGLAKWPRTPDQTFHQSPLDQARRAAMAARFTLGREASGTRAFRERPALKDAIAAPHEATPQPAYRGKACVKSTHASTISRTLRQKCGFFITARDWFSRCNRRIHAEEIGRYTSCQDK